MSTTVLGLRVQTLLEVVFFAEFICSNTILALILASMYLTLLYAAGSCADQGCGSDEGVGDCYCNQAWMDLEDCCDYFKDECQKEVIQPFW